MPSDITRRSFLHTAAAAAAVSKFYAEPGQAAQATSPGAKGPVVIASANGLQAVAKAAELIGQGVDPVDAVVAGVSLVEADPADHSVGYGGLPNERGVVELDASVMHGPTHKCGAVAAIQRIMHPSQVALLVMRRTDHQLIVGEGALEFARAHGFPEENLLTDEARKIWLKWKETHSDKDDWLPLEGPPTSQPTARRGLPHRTGPDRAADESWEALVSSAWHRDGILHTHGTINCNAVAPNGDIAGCTTTSGLSYKIPGRVGDSPIIGAGLYVDNEVGAAGATGRGEAVAANCGAFAIVEFMRQGKPPQDACLAALQRIVDHTRDPRLLRADGRPSFGVTMYAVAKDGTLGSAAIYSGAKFAVFSEGRARLEPSAYLFETPKA